VSIFHSNQHGGGRVASVKEVSFHEFGQKITLSQYVVMSLHKYSICLIFGGILVSFSGAGVTWFTGK